MLDVQQRYAQCVNRVQAACKGEPRCTAYYTAACFASAYTEMHPVKRARDKTLHGLGEVTTTGKALGIAAVIGLGYMLLKKKRRR